MLWFEAVQCFDVCSFCGRWEVRLPRGLPAGDLLGWRLFGLRAGTVHVSPSKTYVYSSPRRLSHGSKVHGDVYSFKTFQSSREEFLKSDRVQSPKIKIKHPIPDWTEYVCFYGFVMLYTFSDSQSLTILWDLHQYMCTSFANQITL